MTALIRFELSAFSSKIWFYLLLLFFALFGFVIATKANQVSIPNVYKNAPYSHAYFIGFFSLICLFISSLLAAKVLFKEKDSHFDLILYTTPLSKMDYLASRFLVVFGITLLCFFTLIVGYAVGQQMPWLDRTAYGPLSIGDYLHPFLVLGVPNALFCSAVVCSVGFLTKNKLLVYTSGLFIYIFYLVVMLFSGSPLLVGSFPQSPEMVNLSAQFDPFGLSAFFQQTMHWGATQRNTQRVALEGNFLFSRLLFITISCFFLLLTYKIFRFSVGEKSKKVKEIALENPLKNPPYRTINPQLFNGNHTLKSLVSFVKIDLTYVVKSIPFLLILIGLAFYESMEIYGEIDKGIRLPENYASTGLMVNRILNDFHGLCLIVLLFYSNEIVWHSRNSRFNTLENTTPTSPEMRFFAKWLSLNALILIFLTWIIAVAITFQIVYQCLVIEWDIYATLFYLVGLPLMLSAGMMTCIQVHIKNKYVGLILAFVFVILTTSSMGKLLGFSHRLMRFNASYAGKFSDMNGWGAYFEAFGWQMLFGVGLTFFINFLLFTPLSIFSKNGLKTAFFSFKKLKFARIIGLMSLLMGVIYSGSIIFNQVKLRDKDAEKEWQQAYELKYRVCQNQPQPTVTDVTTTIDLFPEKNMYKVFANYTLQNKTTQTIDSILLYSDKGIVLKNVTLTQGIEGFQDADYGHYWFKLTKPLQPKDTLKMAFDFACSWNAFNGHESFNAIVENGSFMRISNYFPKFGYQSYHELTDETERTKRHLGKATAILSLEDPLSTEDDFINFDAVVSTSKNQTAIAVGELVHTWKNADRNFFHYKTNAPIPFRIGIASATYAVQKAVQNGINIEVYYHPKHAENVPHLLKNAQLTLAYCEKNFGKYPFKTIRFAEISAFTRGFAATAYPAAIFMPEDMIFHANIKGDKQQDVINELAGHELAHEWWGAHQLTPDNREGAKFLTETLAMYTELMLVKKMYGQKRVLENVVMHQDMYLSQRGFADEQPLYKTLTENTHLHYSKGLITMYQLSELIGEDKVNTALKSLLKQHAYPNPVPISTDLLTALYTVSDASVHPKIDDLFKRIITYKMAFGDVQSSKIDKLYTIDLELNIEKFEEDGRGKQSKIPFNDGVEVAFFFDDGQVEIRTFLVGNNAFKTSVSFSKKVVKMTIDPSVKYIKWADSKDFEFK